MSGKVEVENVNRPGQVSRVDGSKYDAMKQALLAGLGDGQMTAKELKAALLPHLPGDLFPGGATAGWWLKCVQLDLEAKGGLRRHPTKPLSWSRV